LAVFYWALDWSRRWVAVSPWRFGCAAAQLCASRKAPDSEKLKGEENENGEKSKDEKN
jgi:hypothetical protein